MRTESDYLIIGKVCRPFGVAGELKVLPITDDMRRFGKLKFIYHKRGKSFTKIPIETVRYTKQSVILKLKDYNCRDSVAVFSGSYLYIDRENAIQIDEQSYYYYDLAGCIVVNNEGSVIGKVSDIINAGTCDVYVVSGIGEEEDHRFIPAVKEVVKKIDIKKKEITIDVIDGLF
ncbi:MAG: hypothetical protein AMS17_10235 [Spirochaetes bacterium DG_61]|nr:MAG: hypothetical protein AMS17_10235 [Spirochaetes bacterium DG_61]